MQRSVRLRQPAGIWPGASQEISDAAQKIMARYDPLGTKLRQLTSDMAAFRKEMGNSTRDDVMRTFQGLENEIGKVSGLMEQAGVSGAAGMHKAAEATERSAFATASARRELIVLGHEVITGRWNRLPGSLMVLGERTDLLRGLFSGLGVAIGAGAAVLGTFAAVAAAGAVQAQKLNNELTLTGGYAGFTADSFHQMADSLGTLTGAGIGKAKEALMALTATGKVSNDVMQMMGETILRQSQLSGEKLEDIAKDYAKMSEGVLKWAVDHNESMHFMTAAQYEHIKALEEAGDKTGAMTTVMGLLDGQMAKSTDNVGYLTRAWRGLGGAVSWVIDKMMSFGRPETIGDRLDAAAKEVDAARARLLQHQFRGRGDTNAQASYDSALDNQNSLFRQSEISASNAYHTAEQARIQQDGIKALEWTNKLIETYDKAEGKKKAYAEASLMFSNAAAAGTPISPEKQQEVMDSIDKKFQEHTQKVSQAKTEYEQLIDRLQQKLAVDRAEAEAGDKLTAGEKLRLDTMVQMDFWRKKATDSQKANVKDMLDEIVATETLNHRKQEANKELEADNKNRQEALDRNKKEAATLDEQIAKQREHNESIGQSKDAIAALTAQRELDKASTLEAAAIKKLDRDLDFESYDATMKRVAAMRELAKLQEQGGVLQEQFDNYQKVQKSMWGEIDKTAQSVWTNIFEGGQNAFVKLRNTLKSTLLDLLYQMAVRPFVINVVANLMGQGGNTDAIMKMIGAGGSNSGGLASLLGNANGAGNLIGGLGNAYSVGSSWLTGGMSTSNALGTLAANGASGDALDALMAGNGAFGTAAGLGGVTAGTSLAGIGSGVASFGVLDTAAAATSAGIGGGAVAAGGGLMGAGAAALAAIPVAGWIALGVAALATMFGGKKHGPKTDGFFGPGTSSIGHGTQDAATGQAAQAGAMAIQAQYNSIVSGFGGVGGAQFGFGISRDPKGTSPSFITAGAVDANGNKLFTMDNTNAGRSDQELQQAITEMSAKAILKSLQAVDWSKVNPALGAAVNSLGPVDSMTGAAATAAATRFQTAAAQRGQLQAQIDDLLLTDEQKLTKQRQAELDAVDDLNKALVNELHAAQDLVKAKNDLLNAYQAEANFAQTLRSYLGQTGSSGDFHSVLAAARAGDPTARTNLTGAADAYIKNATEHAHTAMEASLAQAEVTSSLSELVDSLDAHTKQLTDLGVLTTAPSLSFDTALSNYLGAKGKVDASTSAANNPQNTGYTGPNVQSAPAPDVAGTQLRFGGAVITLAHGFASGGTFRGGARLVGESGPELEVTGPSHISSASETRRLLSGDNVVQAVHSLSKVLSEQKKALEAIAMKTAQTTTILNELRIRGVQVRNSEDNVQLQVHTV
jgi:phage-related minor tail protein